MTVRSLLLMGVDCSPRRLGFGVVDLETGAPLGCGCEQLWTGRETVSWAQKRFRTAVRNVAAQVEALGEVQAIYMEYPISRFPRASFDNGRAFGIVQGLLESRWPHTAPVQELRPAEWRVLAGLPGNASKADVWNHAYWRVSNCPGMPEPVNQDAADALLIAIAGQKRNAESWQRGVDRGAA